MPEENPQSIDSKQRYALEFWLVVIMLGVLFLLVVFVLAWRTDVAGSDGAQLKEALQYRTNILSVIITAYGKPTHFFTTSEVRKLLLQSE